MSNLFNSTDYQIKNMLVDILLTRFNDEKLSEIIRAWKADKSSEVTKHELTNWKK